MLAKPCCEPLPAWIKGCWVPASALGEGEGCVWRESLRGLWCNQPHCHKQCSLVWKPSDRLHSSEFECLSFPHQWWFTPPSHFAWCCFHALHCWQAIAGFFAFMPLYKHLWEHEVENIITLACRSKSTHLLLQNWCFLPAGHCHSLSFKLYHFFPLFHLAVFLFFSFFLPDTYNHIITVPFKKWTGCFFVLFLLF